MVLILSLQNTHFLRLPREIENLANLQELDVSSNQLFLLPSQLGACTKLRSLLMLGNEDLAITMASMGSTSARRIPCPTLHIKH